MSVTPIATGLLTPEEATLFADARRVLAEIDARARNAGWNAVDPVAAMSMGRIAEAADTARDVLTSFLIAAHVYADDVEAKRALRVEREEVDAS